MTQVKLVERHGGLVADGDGWYVVNVRDAAWYRNASFGASTLHQERSKRLGVNLGVLEPGKPNCLYHEESNDEAFLVLQGECVLVVEGEERTLRAWDYFFSPAGTRHVFVGAGSEPCAILFIGARDENETLLYPLDEVAARHGASVTEETNDPQTAYASFPDYEPASAPDGMPWNS